MQLTRASRQLFARQPDERFESLQTLWSYCQNKKERSLDRWHPPQSLGTVANGNLKLALEGSPFDLNDWSYSQLCRLAGVAKETVNRLSPATPSCTSPSHKRQDTLDGCSQSSPYYALAKQLPGGDSCLAAGVPRRRPRACVS